ncbi:MAG TPA: NADH:flavin oxidoreductase/NADH oxidase family protein [Acidimicrobiales bacterium]|nr:NADH:flavin oxidoreductase/NADH oxidase family protein [Acidimicrobiales bacterium]
MGKAAMSEQLGDRAGRPTAALIKLYTRWAQGGAGLLVTGNVIVDRSQPVEPYNVVIDGDADVDVLARWAEAARSGGAHVWVELNHPGRQAPWVFNRRPVAPSPVRLRMGGAFARPRALTGREIADLIDRFGRASAVVESAGFTGVEVHAAHGYLISQFLSPLTNRRTDEWGGTLEGRMRLLLETVRAVRARVSAGFAVAVKLNSADFQRGGFDLSDAVKVVDALNDEGVDLVEVTGGNYESPTMSGDLTPTGQEAYFLDYARQVRQVARMPLMLTGGLRSTEVMAEVVAGGAVDVVGLARPMATLPDLPARLLGGAPIPDLAGPRLSGWRLADLALHNPWHNQQMRRLGQGLDPDPDRGLARTAAYAAATALRWRMGLGG